MARSSKSDSRRTAPPPTRGGYLSSSKPVSALKPPPTGPAPGAAKPNTNGDGQQKNAS